MAASERFRECKVKTKYPKQFPIFFPNFHIFYKTSISYKAQNRLFFHLKTICWVFPARSYFFSIDRILGKTTKTKQFFKFFFFFFLMFFKTDITGSRNLALLFVFSISWKFPLSNNIYVITLLLIYSCTVCICISLLWL